MTVKRRISIVAAFALMLSMFSMTAYADTTTTVPAKAAATTTTASAITTTASAVTATTPAIKTTASAVTATTPAIKTTVSAVTTTTSAVTTTVPAVSTTTPAVITTAQAVIVPKTASATSTASKVLVNGTEKAFDAYNINGNNYFKLRDLANTVNSSKKQFEVSWDGTKNAINLKSNSAYTAVGGEMAASDGKAKTATLSTSKIYKDGVELELTAYNIGGNNYFKLRDVAQAFNIGVTWDDKTNTIGIDANIDYLAK